jgi:hypothetical protein
MPIYLEEMESYYIVIFSYDKDTTIEYSRFRQGDYERIDAIDQLVLIEKSTGYIFNTTDYDLIGNEIDLNSFQEGKEVVTFNVFLPHEERISHVRWLYIEDDYSLETHASMYQNFHSEPMGGNWLGMIGHVHVLGDPSWVEVFDLSDDFFYYKDSYGKTYAGYLHQDENWINFKQSVDLTEERFASSGYYKLDDNGIYYVNNDMDLVYTLAFQTVVIKENVNLENWEDHIPNDGI